MPSKAAKVHQPRARSLRVQAKRAPQVIENPKNAMFIRGSKTSQTVVQLLKELYMFKKPYGLHLSRRNESHPFDAPTTIEFLAQKNDCSLFAFGSHSKKRYRQVLCWLADRPIRPNNIIMGRTFDYHILDMIEFGVENFKSYEEFESDKVGLGNKPCFVFVGEEWDQKQEYKKLANLFLDFYQGEKADLVNLAGLEHVIVLTAAGDKIFFRVYRIQLKKSGSRIPRVELEEMGPFFDITIRRHQFASPDLEKMAFAVPREAKVVKEKNVLRDDFATKGTLHVPRQDLSKIATKKMKGLKRTKAPQDQKQI